MEVAVVGCGHMGTHHARTVAQHPDCKLVAAVDLIPERAERIAGQFGGEGRTSVPDGVEAIVVATPTVTHCEVALPLGRAGTGTNCGASQERALREPSPAHRGSGSSGDHRRRTVVA